MWTSSGRFNPRSPCGERRKLFIVLGRHIDFNPRSPCGERRELFPRPFCQAGISIHAPRVGSDTGGDNNVDFERAFQSTLPVRGSTGAEEGRSVILLDFNPRSPCGERRWYKIPDDSKNVFQSTLPVRGATPPPCRARSIQCGFNPRSPCGERLREFRTGSEGGGVSIHAPRAGSDPLDFFG